jgi:hypothetical protein
VARKPSCRDRRGRKRADEIFLEKWEPSEKIYRGIGILRPLPYLLVIGPGMIRSPSRYVPLVLHLSGYSVPALSLSLRGLRRGFAAMARLRSGRRRLVKVGNPTVLEFHFRISVMNI